MSEALLRAPNNPNIHEEPVVYPLSHVPLSRIIGDAAHDAGLVVTDRQFINAGGGPVFAYDDFPLGKRQIGRNEVLEGETEVSNEGASNTSTIVARSSRRRGIEDGGLSRDVAFTIDDLKQLRINTETSSGKKIESNIDVTNFLNEEKYPGIAVESKYVDGNEVYTYRPMSPRRLEAAKRLASMRFGLEYKSPQHPRLKHYPIDTEKAGRTQFDSDIIERVDLRASALEAKGLTGTQLRRALMKEVHPDSNPDDPKAKAMYQYASLLQLP